MKSLLSIITLFTTVALSAQPKCIGIHGGFAFPQYMSVPGGSVSYDHINNKRDLDFTCEVGYKQVPRGSSWLETSRSFGITVSCLYKIARPLYLGPCFGIVYTAHSITHRSDYFIFPEEVEDVVQTNFIGGKAALIFGDRSRVKFKMQARALCGVAFESITHDDMRFSIIPAFSAGFIVRI